MLVPSIRLKIYEVYFQKLLHINIFLKYIYYELRIQQSAVRTKNQKPWPTKAPTPTTWHLFIDCDDSLMNDASLNSVAYSNPGTFA